MKKNPWRKILTILLVALFLILCCGTIFATFANRKTLANEISSVVKTEEAQYYSPTPEIIVHIFTPVPSVTPAPTATLAPTLAPTATKVPTIAPSPTFANPFAWVGADTSYKNETVMTGGKTFKGPGVCEWWDQKGFAFEATYNRQKDEVKTLELHEGMFFLTTGYSYTYPEGYVGKCWNVENDAAVAKLSTSYRHLLFFSNIYGNDSTQIKALKADKYIWDGLVVDGKGQHIYMHSWLEKNDLGSCNFKDQRGCKYLALIVVQVPLGTTIK